MRLTLISNHSAISHSTILEQLATDAGSVRLEVAANPNTSAATLKKLATDADSYVRRGVAKNPNIPVEALVHSGVRLAAAKNPNIPVEALVQLATDEDSGTH